MGQTDQPTGDACCKVGRVARTYDLDGLAAELERRWTGRDGEQASVRELQREVNRRILASALVTAGVPPIAGEAENLRRVLTGEDVSESRQVAARRRLATDGVAVDGLLDDFVSHQTVHNHLRNCRGLSAPGGQSDADRRTQAKSTVFGLQNRTRVVTEGTLDQLGANGLLSPAEYDVVVDVQAICERCGRSHDVGGLIDRGGCQCDR